MRNAKLALLTVAVVALSAYFVRVSARIMYAKETGKRCIFCHATTRPSVSDLHWAGKYYAEKRTLKGYTPDQVTSAALEAEETEAATARSSGSAAETDLRELRQIYQAKCAACHAPTGQGVPGLNARNFTDRAWQASHSDEEIRQAIEKGRLPLMPRFADSLDEDTIRGLVKVVRQFAPTEKDEQ